MQFWCVQLCYQFEWLSETVDNLFMNYTVHLYIYYISLKMFIFDNAITENAAVCCLKHTVY